MATDTAAYAHAAMGVWVVRAGIVDCGPGLPLSFIEADRPYVGKQ
jgi:hypothetical protein